MNLNKCLFIGNLTRDPDLRYTSSGAAVCNFRIAINRRYTTKDGEKRDETHWQGCTAWNKTAETIAKYVQKGDPILVEGHMTTREWDAEDGTKRSAADLVVDAFQFMPRKPRDGETPTEREIEQQSLPSTDDDMPF